MLAILRKEKDLVELAITVYPHITLARSLNRYSRVRVKVLVKLFKVRALCKNVNKPEAARKESSTRKAERNVRGTKAKMGGVAYDRRAGAAHGACGRRSALHRRKGRIR